MQRAGGAFVAELPQRLAAHLLAGEAIILLHATPDPTGVAGIGVAIAALASPNLTNFMAKHFRGILSATLDPSTACRLGIAGDRRRSGIRRKFLTSVEAASCAGTGISAADRAKTLRCLGGADVCRADIVTPGHIVPILVEPHASDEALLPESAHLLLGKLASLSPEPCNRSAAWCDILDENGAAASAKYCLWLARLRNIPVVVRRGGRFSLVVPAVHPRSQLAHHGSREILIR